MVWIKCLKDVHGLVKEPGLAGRRFKLKAGQGMNVPAETAIKFIRSGLWANDDPAFKVPELEEKISSGNQFYDELVAIKGIGPEIAKDVISIYPDSERLKIGILQNKLPWDKKINRILTENFKRGE